MKYDYSALLGKIIEVYGTRANFASAMQLSERSVYLKLNNKVPWKSTEIARAVKLLGIDSAHMHVYFFTEKVHVS